MDFPTCPSCGQSVIDDDAEDCPFCGSSMKAKPGAKPAAGKSATGSAAKAAPKPGVSASKSAGPGVAKSGGDDFPFDTEIPGAGTAIQAMPNPSKGRTLKIVCPMCETSGYVPPAAVGKEVKCANPKCMVPVFKAPAPVEEAPPPPPPKKSNMPLVGGITAAIMVIIGGVAYVVSSMPSGGDTKKPGQMSQEDLEALQADLKGVKTPAPVQRSSSDILDLGSKNGGKQTTVDTGPKTPDEYIKATIKLIGETCLVGEKNRSKPYCRQLAAECAAIIGDSGGLASHLDQLVKVGSSVQYYRIEPNLESFWIAWTAGDKGSATKALTSALNDVQDLPKVGRNHMEVAGRLASALAVSGRIPDGITQLEGHQSSDLVGQLAARVQMATEGRVARLTNVRTVLPWDFPQAVAVTDSLISHGQVSAAKAWALAQPKDVAKSECLALWAEFISRKQATPGAADSNPEIVSALAGMEPALAARVWARAACGRWIAGDMDGALATVKVASETLSALQVPSEPTMPELKQTAKAEVPDAAPLIHGAVAAAEIAFVNTLWPERINEANAALDLALSYARGIAPGMPAIVARQNEANKGGSNGLRDLLRKQLGLKNDDLARQAASNFNYALNKLAEAAKIRLTLQTRILSRLAEFGLKDKVWTIVSDRSLESNLNRRDDLIDTQLTAELLELFQGTETEKIILGAINSGVQPARPPFAYVKSQLRANDVSGAGEYVSTLDQSSGLRDEIALTFATYLASTGKADTAFAFIAKLKDIVLREEAYRMTAALAARNGETELVWKQMNTVTHPTDKVSLGRGLIAGLKLPLGEKDLAEPALEK